MKRASLFIIYLLCINAQAQSPAAPDSRFRFNGTSSLTAYYSNRQFYGQEIPPQYLTWQLRSQVTLFDVPLNLSLLLSTQQRAESQSMNHFSLGIDVRSLTRRLAGTERLRFLRAFETLEIGRTRPYYSQLILNGMSVGGVNAAIRFGSFHAAVVYGKSQRPVQQGAYLEQQYQQNMAFGQLGTGRKEQSHVNLSFLWAKDDEKSIHPTERYYIRQADTLIHHLDTLFMPLDSTPVFRRPRETHLAGIGIGTSMFNRKFRLSGEAVVAMNTGNTQSAAVSVEELPEWVTGIHATRLTTSVSAATNLQSELDLGKHKIAGIFRMVGPGYHSPGTPFMRQDFQSVEMRSTHALLGRKLMIQPRCRLFRDNLAGQKAGTTNTLIWGINLMWRPGRLPYVGLNVSPHKQTLETGTYISENKAMVITLTSGKNYLIGKQLNAFTGFSWSNQQSTAKQNDVERRFRGNNLSLQQTVRFPFNLGLTVQTGYYHLLNEDVATGSVQAQFRAMYNPTPAWQVEAGIRYFNRNREQQRLGGQLQATYKFRTAGEIRLSAEPVIYRDMLDPAREYEQYIIRLSLINKW